eukprot:6482925-Amphidinium_carterae.2
MSPAQWTHSHITQFLHERNLAVVLQVPEDNSYSMTNCTEVTIPVLAYHQRCARDPPSRLSSLQIQQSALLVDARKELVNYAIPCYEGRELLIHWSRMKRELMVTIRRPKLLPSMPHVPLKPLSVVRSYNYLGGRRVTDTGSASGHGKVRSAIAAASIRQCGRVYHLPSFTEGSRALWLQIITLDKCQWGRWIQQYVEND